MKIMINKLADMEKKNREERIAYQSSLTSDVKSMLADFARARIEKARIASDQRKALLLEIRKQVAGSRKPVCQPVVTAIKPKAVKPIVAVPAKAKAVVAVAPMTIRISPRTEVPDLKGFEPKDWLREKFGKAVSKAKRKKTKR